jgi:hypothetical protein
MNSFPNKIQDSDKQLAELMTRKASMEQYRSIWSEMQRLKTKDIPELQESVRTLSDEHAQAVAKSNEVNYAQLIEFS